MDAIMYVDILKNTLKPFIDEVYPDQARRQGGFLVARKPPSRTVWVGLTALCACAYYQPLCARLYTSKHAQ